MKVERLDDGRLYFDCPGCGFMHALGVDDSAPAGARWTWNESLDKPTFSPSILVTWSNGAEVKGTCHSYVTDGRIQFLGDCTHEMRGQTMDLPEVEIVSPTQH